MLAAGTPSSQTVCQMPEMGVYQMLFGRKTCLPRCCIPVSVGSQAETTQLVLTLRQRIGDVKGKGQIAACVISERLCR